MTVKEIMRTTAGKHRGYMPVSVAVSRWTVKECETMFRRLKRIPRKVTAYFDRAKIRAAYRSDCYADPRDEYYLLVATDGTVFHVEY